MEKEKVRYLFGNNEKFNYFVIAERNKITVNENSLAFKFDQNSQEVLKIDFNGVHSNFEYLLEKKDLNNKFMGYILCNSDEIKTILN